MRQPQRETLSKKEGFMFDFSQIAVVMSTVIVYISPDDGVAGADVLNFVTACIELCVYLLPLVYCLFKGRGESKEPKCNDAQPQGA